MSESNDQYYTLSTVTRRAHLHLHCHSFLAILLFYSVSLAVSRHHCIDFTALFLPDHDYHWKDHLGHCNLSRYPTQCNLETLLPRRTRPFLPL